MSGAEGNKENADEGHLESDVWLERLERLANHKAASSDNIADLEKAASAALLIADARRTRAELHHQTYRFRLEEAKSWALIAMPFLLLIALLIFVPKPNQQARALLAANHDTQFREVERTFLGQVTQPASARPDLLLLTVPLQPYLNDPRYSQEAGDLGLLALSRVTSADAFQDYFVSRNIKVGRQNLAAVLTLDRMLYTNFNELDEALNSDNTANLPGVVGRPMTKDQVQRARDGILLELSFLSARTAAYLRSPTGPPLNADLRRVYFKSSDLSSVHFGKSNLEACQWEGVSLINADLSAVVDFENSQWIDTNWWEAHQISKLLLNYLITTQYPFHPPAVDYTNAPSSKDAYEQKVLKLCKSSGLACDAARFPYGNATKADKRGKS